MARKPRRNSPLKTTPLRQAGESTSKAADRIIDEVALPWLLIGVMMALLVLWEWASHLLSLDYSPWTITFIGFAAVAASAYMILSKRETLRRYRLGADGERVVGELLTSLSGAGYTVIHDIAGENFNVDHVLIGPAGVFAIETKTRRRTMGRKKQIQFDGAHVRIEDGPPSDQDVRQAMRAASHIAETLRRTMGRSVAVQPVVIYPEWYVVGPEEQADVWVMNQKRFAGAVRRARHKLSPPDQRLCVEALATVSRAMGRD